MQKYNKTKCFKYFTEWCQSLKKHVLEASEAKLKELIPQVMNLHKFGTNGRLCHCEPSLVPWNVYLDCKHWISFKMYWIFTDFLFIYASSLWVPNLLTFVKTRYFTDTAITLASLWAFWILFKMVLKSHHLGGYVFLRQVTCHEASNKWVVVKMSS